MMENLVFRREEGCMNAMEWPSQGEGVSYGFIDCLAVWTQGSPPIQEGYRTVFCAAL